MVNFQGWRWQLTVPEDETHDMTLASPAYINILQRSLLSQSHQLIYLEELLASATGLCWFASRGYFYKLDSLTAS